MAKRLSYQLIHEDQNYIVVNKSPNVLVIQDRYDHGLKNIKSMLEARFGDIFVVHRLDRGTSGVLCFARNEAAHKHLNQQFENRLVRKNYLAICNGELIENEGTLDALIAKNDHKKGQMVVVKSKGQSAITHYKVLERFKNYTLVDVHIETGRTHQIRVHLSSLGHPLVGDPPYGGQESVSIKDLKKYIAGTSESDLIARPALHAHSLVFQDIETNKMNKFECDLPKDMRALLTQLRKWKSL